MISLALFAFAAFSVCSGQFLNCGWVASLDCASYSRDPQCGTNTVTYKNRCEFAKAQCNNKALHIALVGACPSNIASTTSGSGPIVTTQGSGSQQTTKATTTQNAGPTTTHAPVFLGHNVVLDFFCLELSHEKCPTDTEQVCGDNNKTFANFCEYEKYRCTHRELKVLHYGAC